MSANRIIDPKYAQFSCRKRTEPQSREILYGTNYKNTITTLFYQSPRTNNPQIFNERTAVTLLRWTVARLLEEAVRAFPTPVSVKLEAGTVVVVDYQVWKTKILSRQHELEGNNDG